MDIPVIVWAIIGGIFPAGLWLWFWLKEDAPHPEPMRLIVITFLSGLITVPLALALERGVALMVGMEGALTILLWAAVEELLKFSAAYAVAFRGLCIDNTRCLDEPIDPFIYLMTAALGFAAMENALFLWGPLGGGEIYNGIFTGALRFVGATILHVVASAAIGIAMGLAFFKSRNIKLFALIFGLCTAILLHTLFNLFIINSSGFQAFFSFATMWIVAIVALRFLESIKD